MEDKGGDLSGLAPIAQYIAGIADRGSTYALIVLGALAGAVALVDRLAHWNTLSAAEFIVVLGVGGALLLAGALLQFLTENALRVSVADGQRIAGQETAAAGERYLRSIEIAKEAGETDIDRATDRYLDAMKAIEQTNTYGTHVAKAKAEGAGPR